MTSRFIITVVEKTQEIRIEGREWKVGAGDAPEDWGYTPEIEKFIDVNREVFKQNVDELDLAEVIKAVNGI